MKIFKIYTGHFYFHHYTYSRKSPVLFMLFVLILAENIVYGQQRDTSLPQPINISHRFFEKLEDRTTSADRALSKQTISYLNQFSRLDARLMAKLQKLDSSGTKQIPGVDYRQWENEIQSPVSGSPGGKTYVARLDTLRTTLAFLQNNPGVANSPGLSSEQVTHALGQAGQLQAHLDESALLSDYVAQRRQQIAQYLSKFSSLPAEITGTFAQYKASIYYYRQQLAQFKSSLNDPQKIEQQAINQLNKLPAYQQFLAKHSLLASLFQLPASNGDSYCLQGLQTKDQVQQLMQGQVNAGGQSGQASIDQQVQLARSQLSNMQSNLTKYGVGGQDLDMPNFQPNQQKTRTFLKRLTYGVSIQLSKSTDYFPATGDVGLAVGYKINDKSTVGVGASYNIGLGSDWGHMQFSSQGVGLRSYMDWQIKKTYYATGGYELNYMTQFNSIAQLKDRQLWQPSLLIGLEKKYKISSKLQGNLQVLFDALYRQEIPAGQMFKFRIGYVWR